MLRRLAWTPFLQIIPIYIKLPFQESDSFIRYILCFKSKNRLFNFSALLFSVEGWIFWSAFSAKPFRR